MKVIWAFENLSKSKSFYRKLDFAMFLASVRLWTRHNPGDYRVLYCDEITRDLLVNLGVHKFWHEVIDIDTLPKIQINNQIFWSSVKVRALAVQREPVLIIDNDFLTFSPLGTYLNPDKICYSHTEDGRNYYPNFTDPFVSRLSYKISYGLVSCNVSFLYLPDPEFTKMYTGLSLQVMKEFSEMNVPNDLFTIFAEQLVLKSWMVHTRQDYQCLYKPVYICREEKFSDKDEDYHGFFTEKEASLKFRHYGPHKRLIKKDLGPRSYEEEFEEIFKFIGLPGLDLSNLKK